jgi:hypothetical protein
MIWPSLSGSPPRTRHLLIGLYRLTPLALGCIQPLYSKAASMFYRDPFPHHSDRAGTYVNISLRISALSAIICHFAAIITAICSENSSLNQVFNPSGTQIMANSVPGIANGAERFLKYDIIVVAVTFMTFSVAILRTKTKLSQGSEPGRNPRNATSPLRIADQLMFAAALISLCPGAMISVTLRKYVR